MLIEILMVMSIKWGMDLNINEINVVTLAKVMCLSFFVFNSKWIRRSGSYGLTVTEYTWE